MHRREHRIPRETTLVVPVSRQRSQGLENRKNRFSALFFAVGGSPDRPRPVYRDFWDVPLVDRCQEVMRHAGTHFLTILPFATIHVHSRKPFFRAGRVGPHQKKSYRNLKNHDSDQKSVNIITLQKSTTWLNGWFGKLRLGARSPRKWKRTANTQKLLRSNAAPWMRISPRK